MKDVQDIVSDITAYEEGELSEDEMIDLFQRLVDSGWVWQFQGSYQRTAVDLIEAGLVIPPECRDSIENPT